MIRIWLIFLGDLIAFWLAFVATLSIRYENFFPTSVIKSHLLPFGILYVCFILVFFLFGFYDLYSIKPTLVGIKRFFLALIVAFIIGVFLFYLAPIFGIYPKTILLFETLGFGIFSFFIRRLFYEIFANQITRKAIILGNTEYTIKLAQAIERNPALGIKIFFYGDDLDKALSHSMETNSVLIFEKNSYEISKTDMTKLYENGVEIMDTSLAYEKYLYKVPIGYINQSWIIHNVKISKNIMYNFLMRIMDISFAIIILIIFSPFILIAILLRFIEDGKPIIYKQKRVGKNGKVFDLYKIRSMIVLASDGSAENGNVIWAENKDPRITKIGRILRKTHIDELPQMINIIKGDLTLVGPRPERPEFVANLEKEIPYYELRHIIRPGFTGWAQIKYHYARSVDDSKEKFEYDLYYIKNRNIFLDFGIILKTIQIIFTH